MDPIRHCLRFHGFYWKPVVLRGRWNAATLFFRRRERFCAPGRGCDGVSQDPQTALERDPFPGVLTLVSLGADRVALNITYILKVDPKMVPIMFFSLKIGLN